MRDGTLRRPHLGAPIGQQVTSNIERGILMSLGNILQNGN